MYYYGPMNRYDWGWGILASVLWLFFFVIIAIIVFRYLRRKGSLLDRSADPIDIAKLRYAKGEITREEFEQIKKDLK